MSTEEYIPTAKDTDRESEFLKDLEKFRKKYPMAYIEVWNPTDFQMSWNSNDAVCVAETLYDNFDANQGTNWDAIETAKLNN